VIEPHSLVLVERKCSGAADCWKDAPYPVLKQVQCQFHV